MSTAPTEVRSDEPAGDGGRAPWILPVVVGALVAALVVGGLAWWVSRGPSGRYADALDTLSDETLRSSFTDWSAVGEQLDVPDVEQAKDRRTVDRFLDEAYDADLVTGSTLLDVIPGLAVNFGYSPADAEWEAYGQARDGAVDVLKMTDDVDFDEIADNLDEAGYDAPDEDDGVWRGTGDLMVELDPTMTTIQINVMLLEDERLVLASDSASFLESTRDVVRGDAASLRDVPGVDGLVGAVEDAVSAELWAGDFACEDLSMTKADPADRAAAARLVEQAGGVHPLDGLVLARTGSSTATIAMWFDSEADADDDLQPRTDLARGPATGQGGDFAERFSVESSRVDGQLITMRIRSRTDSLMGDLGQGPILYAAC